MAKDIDRDQTAPDLGLQCLPKPVCSKTWDHYSITQVSSYLFKQHEFPVLDCMCRDFNIFPQFLSNIHRHCHFIEECEVIRLSTDCIPPFTGLLELPLYTVELVSQLKQNKPS